MTKLYSEYAIIYHEMYQSLFDYEKEFYFYNNILKQHSCISLLELGCGTGNLTPYFLNRNYNYIGLDLFDEMLDIARKNNPSASFVKGDMRNFNLSKKFDSIIISGRSFCYMITNEDIMNSLRSIYKALKNGGILIFDNFKAEAIFSDFKKEAKNSVNYKNKKYTRVSKKTPNLETGWTWNWKATYNIKESEKQTKILKDESILRAFTKDELILFLLLNNFKTLEVIDDDFSFTIIATTNKSSKV